MHFICNTSFIYTKQLSFFSVTITFKMHIHSVLSLLTVAGLADAAALRGKSAIDRPLRARQNGNQLDPNLVQTGSQQDGTDENGQNADGQSPSAT